MTSSLERESVLPRLRGSFGEPFLFEPVCPSTQDLLRGSGLPEGAVAVTDHQTAGRGRTGGVWEDTPGEALLFSLLLRPPLDAALPQLSLVCALAVAESVDAAIDRPCEVKWPNDVLVSGRKVAGILLEGDGDAVICGIGVNVNQREIVVAGAGVPPASMRAVTGCEHDRVALLVLLLEGLEARYREWRTGGLADLLPALEARSAVRGRRVSTAAGDGVAGAIGDDGRLTVALDDGRTVRVESGVVAVG